MVPLIYPPGLDRELQTWLGVLVIAINAILYGLVVVRAARRRSAMNEDG